MLCNATMIQKLKTKTIQDPKLPSSKKGSTPLDPLIAGQRLIDLGVL